VQRKNEFCVKNLPAENGIEHAELFRLTSEDLLLIDHVALLVPHLNQMSGTAVEGAEFFTFNFEKNGLILIAFVLTA